MEDLSGKQFGQYRIVAPLGEGGMASVYKAYQPSVDRYVALKVLPSYYAADPTFVKRFEHEAKVIASLEHPNILPVHDFGESEGFAYLVMRFVEGGTLSDVMTGKPLPLERVSRLIGQIASALDYAHSKGVIHRDIKPSNVLTDKQGNCLLSDFGLAKVLMASPKFTTSGAFIGTPTYASPEQCMGAELDHRSDIYSLGVMLYEMVVGRPPYDAETPMAVVIKHVHDPLPLPHSLAPDIPDAVEKVILKALAKNPNDRYQSAGEMSTALDAVAKAGVAAPDKTAAPPKKVEEPGATQVLQPAGKTVKLEPGQKRRIPAWGLAVGCAVILLALAGVAVLGGVGLGLWTFSQKTPAARLATATHGLIGPATRTATAAPLSARTETPSIETPDVPSTLAATIPPLVWQPMDDLPRTINSLVVDPFSPATLYAGTGQNGAGSGVYKSTDAGLSWTLSNAGLTADDVTALAISHDNPPILYALAGDTVFASSDGAQSWTKMGKPGFFSGFSPRLYVVPNSGQILYLIAQTSGFHRSMDGGYTWMPITEGLPADDSSGTAAIALAFDPTNPNIIYLGTGGFVGNGHGIYKSTDGGETWAAANQGMSDLRVLAAAVDPADPQVVYALGETASHEAALFKSTDGAQTWANIAGRLPDEYLFSAYYDLFICPDAPSMLFVFNGQAALVSGDGGDSWQALPYGESYLTPSTTLVTFAPELAILIGQGYSEGGWRLDAAKITGIPTQPAQRTPLPPTATSAPPPPTGRWAAIADLPRGISSVVWDPNNPQVVYAGTGNFSGSGNGLFKSTDGGQTWQDVSSGLPLKAINALTIGGNPATLYALVYQELYASADGAQTWERRGQLDGFTGTGPYQLVIAGDALFAVGGYNGLIRSDDGGQSWIPCGEGLPQGSFGSITAQVLAVDPADANVVYAGTPSNGVYKSSDGGWTFTASNKGMLDYGISALAINPANPQTLYAGTGAGELFKSDDYGQTWLNFSEKIKNLQSQSPGVIRAISIDTVDADTVYLLADNLGLIVSADSNTKWRLLGKPPENDYPNFSAVGIVTNPDLVVIAGLNNDGGAWRYAIGQKTPTATPTLSPSGDGGDAFPAGDWQSLGDLPRNINTLAYARSNPNIIYASTGGTGEAGSIYKSDDAGLTWLIASNGLPSGEWVQALAASDDGQTVYAAIGAAGDIYISHDSAASWSKAGGTQLWGGFERSLVVAPSNPDVVYTVSNGFGLSRSDDGGQNWASLSTGLPQDGTDVFVLAIAIDPANAGVLYAGTGGFVSNCHGVFKSTDRGDTWTPANAGMLDYCISSIAVDPANSQTVYASGKNGEFFKSLDGGQSWYNLTTALQSIEFGNVGVISAISLNPSKPDFVCMLGGVAGLLCSTNGGQKWQVLGMPSDLNSPMFVAMLVNFDPFFVIVTARDVGAWRFTPK